MSEARRLPVSTKQLRMLYGVARKAGMDNELLHARCRNETGKEHLSQLTIGECARLIDSITGVDTRGKRSQDPRPLDRASQQQINVILGLAKKLGWLQGGDKSRLNGFISKRFGVDRLDWMEPDTASKVTEALKAMLRDGRGERKA